MGAGATGGGGSSGKSTGDAPAKEKSSGNGQGNGQGNGRDTVHRYAQMAHEAIDKVAQTLTSSQGGGGKSSELSERARQYGDQARQYGERARQYGEQARQYGEQTRERVTQHPLQSLGIAFATGVVFRKLFMPNTHTKVRVVKVPVYPTEYLDSGKARKHARRWMDEANESTHRWMQEAGEKMHRTGDSGHHAMKKLGATTAMGMAGAKAMSARMSSKARAYLPEDLDSAKQQLRAKSQQYGGMARTQMQEHPLVGAGLALGVGAVVVSMLMGGRRDEYPVYSQDRTGYEAVDKDGRRVTGEWDGRAYRTYRSDSMMSTDTLVSAGVALGLGMVLGALLRRH